MVSPTRRRQAVNEVQGSMKVADCGADRVADSGADPGTIKTRVCDVSERRACRVLGQPRSTQRYTPRRGDRDRALVQRMLQLVRCHPRYGYRRIWALLKAEGWRVNRKRVYRLWRQEGLKVPRRQRKKRRLGSSANGVVHHRAERKNHVWCYDFVSDQTDDGRTLKLLTIEDEFTRECLAIDVERSITSKEVIEALRFLFEVRAAPEFIRSDNGPEFIAQALRSWLKESGVETLYIEPGSPWENAYAESFNSRFRDELLDRELFTSLREAKVVVEDYRLEYNHRRPHSSLGYLTPAAYAAGKGKGDGATPVGAGSATLRPPQQAWDWTKEQTLTLITTGT